MKGMKNKEAVMTALKTIEVRECEMPVAGSNEVLIEVQYVGICGSDLHFFTDGQIGKKVVEFPFVLGHECAGGVVETGDCVTKVQPGDNVTIEPGRPCGKCEYCRRGDYNVCPNMRFMSSPPTQGLLRKYVSVHESLVFKLPGNVSTLEAAMIEPLAVGMHSAKTGGVALGKTVAILGAGPIGIMTLLACKAMGATKIIVTDLVEERLENAERLGADCVVNSQKEDAVEAILRHTDGNGVSIVLEAAGKPATLNQAVQVVGRNGVIVLVGNQTQPVTMDFMPLMVREAGIKTIYRYCNDYPLTIDAVASGRVDLKQVKPTIFELEDTQQAFLYTLENLQSIIKSIIKIS